MKKFKTLALGMAALLFAACSSDEPSVDNNQTTTTDGDFYATLTLHMPTGASSRAGIGESVGVEVGKDPENTVQKILVVLATKNDRGQYQLLTATETDYKPSGTGATDPATQKYLLNFSVKDLKPGPLDPGSTMPESQVYVFVYCNPTEYILDRFFNNTESNFIIDNINGTITGQDQSTIWQPNNFLMTNKSIVGPVTLPSRDQLVNNYNTPATAFSLGDVDVLRTVARFDFQTTGDNKYEITSMDGVTKMGEVELTHMAMFNIARKFYHLPRTNTSWNWRESSGTSGTTNYELCGDLEKGGNHVMSWNQSNFKNASNLNNTTIRSEYFVNLPGNNLVGTYQEKPLNQGDQTLTWVSIKPSDWNKNTADTDEGWDGSAGTDYRIWRYVTENTIPGVSATETSSQKVGITTGVVFKGAFDPADKTVWNGNVVYLHNNIVYGDFNALKAFVDKNPSSLVANDFKQVSSFNTATAGDDLSKNLLDGVDGDARSNFKAYKSSGNGLYEMYYFYYNRHTNNGNNSLMGEDEFGVVRNNVYKLKVTTCGRLGEPKAPTDPDDPNETENAFFSVSCKVMPWTVRVNNIEF